MKKFTMFACLALALVFALSSIAGEPRIPSKGQSTFYGAGVDYSKAGGDTINLMAPTFDPTNTTGEPLYDGDFEDEFGPNWNNWTHADLTAPTTSHFKVSDTFQTGGNLAAWCGELSLACPGYDGGYGPNWSDLIRFRSAIPNPLSPTTVVIDATVQYRSEEAYDFSYLSYQTLGEAPVNLATYDIFGTDTATYSVTYQPGEYRGDGGNQISIMYRFLSDGAADGTNCSEPGGAITVDDITIGITNGAFTASFTEDFEGAGALPIDEFQEDSFLDMWTIGFPDGVGDFSKLWAGLEDIDPCRTNYSPQAAFIDDGLIVPGTDGTDCITWCYGPGGYIVNTTGGLTGPTTHIYNAIYSPIMDWPNDNYDGCIFTFTAYRHSLLTPDMPGIFYAWAVKTADTDIGQTMDGQPWDGSPYIYYGDPAYLSNAGANVTGKMEPGRDLLQVSIEVLEYPNYLTGNDGAPAPYFDNVRVKVYPFIGPAITAREIDLAQSSFPDRGTIDTSNLGSHSVRFDMAANNSLPTHQRLDPGDSLCMQIVPVRDGAAFDGDPFLVWTMSQNPLFNAFRTSSYGLATNGTAPGLPAVGRTGTLITDNWAFDLPDTGFFFPGDIIHYYIKAVDAIGGVGGSTPQETLLPSNIDGFGDFSSPIAYNTSFTVRALPSITPDGSGGYEQPGVLFINDFGNRGGENEWYFAFANIGLLAGEDFDIYHVWGPSSGVGNGIGGRADHLMLNGDLPAMPGYQEILYTAGDLAGYSIANGDWDGDPSKDVTTFANWLDTGGKDLFVTGDNVGSTLAVSGTSALGLLENYFGATVVNSDVNPLIGSQTTPLVKAVPGNAVFQGDLQSWIAYGGCLGINTFDAVTPFGTGVKIADFTDPSGNVPPYQYSAATLNIMNPGLTQSRVISLPYDLMYVHTDPAAAGNDLPGRAQMLKDVLQYFGVTGTSINVSPVLPGITFQTSNFPNPFNPSTTIKYSMPKTGHLSLSVYNVRGQLVKTLIDGQVEATDSGSIVWDGTNNQGSSVSSGVYFYEARANGEVKVEKMALVK